jgi:hypothetical protein
MTTLSLAVARCDPDCVCITDHLRRDRLQQIARLVRRVRVLLLLADGYMASPDPNFAAKAKDILGLYLQPPENTAVFCADGKKRALPLRPAQQERQAVEEARHGTVSLLAACRSSYCTFCAYCR